MPKVTARRLLHLSMHAVLAASILFAQSTSTADLTPAEVTVETKYRFLEQTFNPPIVVHSAEKSALERTTAEDAATATFSAMRSGAFDWWLSGWDAAGRETLLKPGARTAEQWVESWSKALDGSQVYIVAKASFGQFAIIAYEIRLPSAKVPVGSVGRDGNFTDDGIWRGRLTFRMLNDEWLQTNALSDHPVRMLWRSGQDRLVKIASEAIDGGK